MTTENAAVSEGSDLATMLRSWRARVRPEDVGSPFARGTRRTPGLRREEVGWLAGVSPDYVKRLEQGRAHPSADVLRALSRALRLTDTEFKLACRLAGHAAELDGTVPQLIGPSVQRLLSRRSDVPIAVFDAAWTLLEPNDLWAALHGETRRRAGRETNLVWRTFHNDPGRVRTIGRSHTAGMWFGHKVEYGHPLLIRLSVRRSWARRVAAPTWAVPAGLPVLGVLERMGEPVPGAPRGCGPH